MNTQMGIVAIVFGTIVLIIAAAADSWHKRKNK
jgi:hypothetical protein